MLDGLSVDEREGSWRDRLDLPGRRLAPPAQRRSASVPPAVLVAVALPVAMVAIIATVLVVTGVFAGWMLWVLADNPRARRFYEREGWRFDGRRTDTVRGFEVEEALYRIILHLG